MGKAQSKECESEELREAKRLMEEEGIVGVQASIRKKLQSWEDVEIKFCVTGNSGVGKSSFINAFRGIDDEDDGAAEIDVVEATSEPTCYTYRDNLNITLTDLPGIGTPKYPNLQVYCEKFELERYDTFLILTATRFTQFDLELAQKIKSMGKSFFLIRTKIDVDEDNEKRKKKPNIKEMLRKIQAKCYENVKDLGIRKDEIFLISKHHTDKWDFERLVQAILEKLSTHQKEALILSLKQLSKDIVKRKVEVLRSRLWTASVVLYAAKPLDWATLPFKAIISYAVTLKEVLEAAKEVFLSEEDVDGSQTSFELPAVLSDDFDELEMAPVGLASIPIALFLLGSRTKFYRYQLGLPEEDSNDFKKMKPEFQNRMRKFYPKEDKRFWKRCFAFFKNDNFLSCLYPAISDVAMESLNDLLDQMQRLSLDILDDAATPEQCETRGENSADNADSSVVNNS